MFRETLITSFVETYLEKDNVPFQNVHFGNLEEIRRKLSLIMNNGVNQFEVISDFDKTMSKHQHNGKPNPTCHGIFETDPELTDEAKTELTALRNRYYPMEMDEGMSIAQKIPLMEYWWNRSHEIIVNCKIQKRALENTIKCSGLVLREHVPEFTNLLCENDIPILVFSAGLGDVISILLRHFGLFTKNMRVISNNMIFDDRDIIIGFTSPIIHTFNKNVATVAGEIGRRSCVLLLGDTISDARMADGAIHENCDGTVFRIGFLNDFSNTKLEIYKTHYDIVILKNGSFDVPLALVKCLLDYWKATNSWRLDADKDVFHQLAGRIDADTRCPTNLTHSP